MRLACTRRVMQSYSFGFSNMLACAGTRANARIHSSKPESLRTPNGVRRETDFVGNYFRTEPLQNTSCRTGFVTLCPPCGLGAQREPARCRQLVALAIADRSA